MKASKREYIIPFVGLKLGKHEYNYSVNDTFFEDLEYSPISAADLTIHLELEKKETMLIANFTVEGTVKTNCDRCDAPMELHIDGDLKIIYKFGTEESDDENLIVLHPEDFELDLTDPIYQLSVIALPARRIHEPGECNEEMWKLIQKYSVNSDEDDDDEDWDDDEEEDDLGFDDFDPKDPKWTLINKN